MYLTKLADKTPGFGTCVSFQDNPSSRCLSLTGTHHVLQPLCARNKPRNRQGRCVLAAAESPNSQYEVEALRLADTRADDQTEKSVSELKQVLLTATAGLDRGLSSTARQADLVKTVAGDLERRAGSVELDWIAGGKVRSTLEDLDGTWRLMYSSAFESGNLGGSRPGPPAALVPFKLGPIYQVIDARAGDLNNVVELEFSSLPFLDQGPRLRIYLGHSFSVQGVNGIRIVYESTKSEVLLGEGVAKFMGQDVKFEPPAVQQVLPQDLRAATFDVTFLDSSMRITRGDRKELRIYLRDTSALGAIALDDPDTANTYSTDQL